MITDEAMREAISRIGMTPDGEMLYLYLQRRVCRVVYGADMSTLPEENGKRILASELMELMSQGMQDSHAGSRADRAVIFARPKPVDIRHSAGGKRGIVGSRDFKSEFGDGSDAA